MRAGSVASRGRVQGSRPGVNTPGLLNAAPPGLGSGCRRGRDGWVNTGNHEPHPPEPRRAAFNSQGWSTPGRDPWTRRRPEVNAWTGRPPPPTAPSPPLPTPGTLPRQVPQLVRPDRDAHQAPHPMPHLGEHAPAPADCAPPATPPPARSRVPPAPGAPRPGASGRRSNFDARAQLRQRFLGGKRRPR